MSVRIFNDSEVQNVLAPYSQEHLATELIPQHWVKCSTNLRQEVRWNYDDQREKPTTSSSYCESFILLTSFFRFKSPSQLRPQEEAQHKHTHDTERPGRRWTAAARTRSLTGFPPANTALTLMQRREKLPLESDYAPATGNPVRHKTPVAADVSPDFSLHLMLLF